MLSFKIFTTETLGHGVFIFLSVFASQWFSLSLVI